MLNTIKADKACKAALTGHRPQRLSYPDFSPTEEKWKQLIDNLKQMIKEHNITEAYTGMASGCDIAWAWTAIELKHEDYSIKLHCVLPCKDYNSTEPFYDIIKSHADTWTELSEEFYKGCDNIRDQYMVNHCDILIAVWDGIKTGGVWSTIRKAQKANKEVVYYSKEKL